MKIGPMGTPGRKGNGHQPQEVFGWLRRLDMGGLFDGRFQESRLAAGFEIVTLGSR
jgi:hypothetical protein